MRRWLPELSVGRPVTVTIGFITLCVLGAIALSRIPLQMLPSGFTPPYVWVWMPYEVSSPVEAQEKVVRPIEDQLSTVPGIENMHTWAGEEYARVVLEFKSSTDMDDAYNEVVDRLERVRGELPDSVERIGIFRYNPSDDPIFWIGLSVDESVNSPHSLATDVVQRRLQRIPGVAKVELWGINPERVFVDFDRERLAAHGVDLYQVMQGMAADNFQLSGGRVEEAGQLQFVRSLARYEGIEDLKRVPVAPGVRLEHVADISIHIESDGSIQRINGKPGVGLGVFKASGANTVGLARTVRAELLEIEQDPRMSGSTLFAFWDQGKVIEESLNNLKDTAFSGGLFAVLVLFLFLREWRMTLLVAGVIPVALLLTVTVLYFTNRSLNLLSLMGLMVAVGMVVDNAIVVVETIWHRRRDGLEPARAAVEGTAEVSMAILLSTMTTLVVFLPIILLSDDAIFSFFMGAMGFPVCFALLASLLVALVFSPLSTVVFRRDQFEISSRFLDRLADWYARALEVVLNRRADTGLGIIGLVALTLWIPAQAVSCSDVSGEVIGDFSIEFEVPESYTLGESIALLEELEQLVEAHREEWGVSVHRARFSGSRNRGWMTVHLAEDLPPDERKVLQKEVAKILPQRAGVDIWVERDFGGDMGNNSLEMHIVGENSEMLLELSDEVIRRLKSVPEVMEASHTIEDSGSPEIRLVLDREALEEHGLSARWVGPTVAFAMQGTSLPDLRDDGRELDVRARFEADDRYSVENLLDFPLWSATTGASVPLRAVVDTEMSKGFSGISRVNRQASLPINIQLGPGVESELGFAAVGAALADLEFPPGYDWSREEHDRKELENDVSQRNAMILSVVLVFLLMGILFESFLLPLSIIFTIPMAFVGVAWTLWLTGDSMDTMAGVGLVVLIGVVVNNGIVLIDKVTQLRREGLDRRAALLGAGRRRLRPILMTALTTVVGLLPMAFGTRAVLGVPYAPLGRVVAGGLLAGTLLTLFFLPFVYDLLDEMRDRSRGFWSRNLSIVEA